jgi:hypothetical protein
VTRAIRLALLALALGWGGASQAASLASPPFCDRATPMSAAQQDRLLRFAAIVKQELDASRHDMALISRSGVDLERFGLRYSHAGVSLKASANAPWSVRQLYYACDEGRPRLYDQGMAGFLSSTDRPDLGYVSIVLLPGAEAASLERAALDASRSLRLLGADYSANAYPFSTRYQNCNQWVAELIASAWAPLDDAGADDLRERAQAWLRRKGYAPERIDVGSHLVMFAGQFIPWIHLDDHPEDDRYALHLEVSVPASIEAFVHRRVPEAERIELCHDERHVVIHRGWESMGDGCRAGVGDRVIGLE